MKQYIGAIIVLVGVIFLVLHALIGGNWTLWVGIIIEVIGMLAQIFLNKQRKY